MTQLTRPHLCCLIVLADVDANGNEEVYKRASLRVTGDGIDETFDQVGFRYKGAWSLHHCWDDSGGVRSDEDDCARLSTRIKFNEYDDDARLFGFKKLNLYSMMGDRTKMRERLSYSLFNDFGVIAPRTAHAKLYVNIRGNARNVLFQDAAARYLFPAFRYTT